MIRCYITLIIVACIIGCYGRLRFSVPNFKDPLQTKLPGTPIDGWVISHFVMYAILGHLYPSKLPLLFCIGVGWEIIEFWLDSISRECDGVTGICKQFWYGQWLDIWVNFVGLITGKYIGWY